MKNKILYILCALILLVAIIMTAIMGLNVDLYYGEGYTITFTEQSTINKEDIKSIANEIWGNDFIVQNVEFFNESAVIKVKGYTDEQIQSLCDKVNEKYSAEHTKDDFVIEHVSNVKIRSLIEPYILPVGLSLLLILGYYAIRYKGAKQMLNLLKWVVIVEGMIYSIYAIARIQVNSLSVPIMMIAYGLTVVLYTTYSELSEKKNKE